MPNNPIAERDKFSSLSQAESTEPIIIHGKPLDIPKQKYSESVCLYRCLMQRTNKLALGEYAKCH